MYLLGAVAHAIRRRRWVTNVTDFVISITLMAISCFVETLTVALCGVWVHKKGIHL